MIENIILEDIEKIENNFKIEDFKGKRVLVTGGAGFVGSWICDVLANFQTEVVCLDNFSTGKLENIDHLVSKEFFKFVEGDVCNFRVGNYMKFDYIMHLASRASPQEYQQHPIMTLKANSIGSFNVLELARTLDAAILFASTSEVYGDAEVVPTPETYRGNVDPVGVRSCYDEGKRFGEALFMAYHKQYGLDVKIARIFNTFGPRSREDGLYGRVVSRFITQALTNEPITIYGDGAQTRSFCYAADTVTGLVLLALNEKAKGEVVNVGNPREISILELANKIKQVAKSISQFTFHPLPKDDPKRRCPDTGKMEKLLNWKPRVGLEQGLERTITWFQRKNSCLQVAK